MAVEIKEIVIRAVLTKQENSAAPQAADSAEKAAMVKECVAQVLKVLHKKNRR